MSAHPRALVRGHLVPATLVPGNPSVVHRKSLPHFLPRTAMNSVAVVHDGSFRPAGGRMELTKALVQVQKLHCEALVEYERRAIELSKVQENLEELLRAQTLRAAATVDEQGTPVSQATHARTSRRVIIEPHPSPLTVTPLRTGETLPVPSQRCRSKWTSPNSSQPRVEASFTAKELQSARAEAWAERMAAMSYSSIE